MTIADRKLISLLRDYGYRFEGRSLISNGTRPFTSDRIVGQRRSLFDAAESLIPIVREDEFTARFLRLQVQS